MRRTIVCAWYIFAFFCFSSVALAQDNTPLPSLAIYGSRDHPLEAVHIVYVGPIRHITRGPNSAMLRFDRNIIMAMNTSPDAPWLTAGQPAYILSVEGTDYPGNYLCPSGLVPGCIRVNILSGPM